MVEHPKHGWLVTGPSDSPENWFLTSRGQYCRRIHGAIPVTVSCLCALQHMSRGARLLAIDSELREKLDGRARSYLHSKLAVTDNCRNGWKTLKMLNPIIVTPLT